MSNVTDIILVTGLSEECQDNIRSCPLSILNCFLSDRNKGTLARLDDMAGGNKAMQCYVYMAAVSNIDDEAFIKLFLSLAWRWESPSEAQLFIKREDDEKFSVYTYSVRK